MLLPNFLKCFACSLTFSFFACLHRYVMNLCNGHLTASLSGSQTKLDRMEAGNLSSKMRMGKVRAKACCFLYCWLQEPTERLHLLPPSEEVKRQWINSISYGNVMEIYLILLENWNVCVHFTTDCFYQCGPVKVQAQWINTGCLWAIYKLGNFALLYIVFLFILQVIPLNLA